jgi:hypothetical protein
MFFLATMNTTNRPELAQLMIVFITIWLLIDSFFTSLTTLIFVPAFINSEQIMMIRVPAIRKLIFLYAKNSLFEFCLYSLKRHKICSFVNGDVISGNSFLNLLIACFYFFSKYYLAYSRLVEFLDPSLKL